jgi:carbon monoxide dehydrogenase subunit G
MELGDSFTVQAPRERVYEFLTDPNSLAPVLPGIRGYEVHDPDNFTLNVMVGVAHVHGPMKVKMRVVEKDLDDTVVTFNGRAKGIGSNVDLELRFRLNDTSDGGTEVGWDGEARIVGQLASTAGGLLEPLARKNITNSIEAVRLALESSGQPTSAPKPRTRNHHDHG